MKKVLITGANSYIGTSFESYIKKHYNNQFAVDTLDMLDSSWRDFDFKDYDTVFHVAGLAHADVGNVSKAVQEKYYEVNTDLAIETCEKAKLSGVKQFVFMSSAIIYGDSCKFGKANRITKETKPNPSNFYGNSKWLADKGVRELADDSFSVAVLRPPMIYGEGSKGNYPILSKLAKKCIIFPDIDNERSMLYIGNLCEFLTQLMIQGCGGVFWPQNREYVKTSEMVTIIGEANNHRILLSKAFNWCVFLLSITPGKIGTLVNKAFGNLSYDMEISTHEFNYQLYGLKESIYKSEGKKNGN